MTNKLATQKVQQLRDEFGDRKTAEILGMSRNTMYKCLSNSSWSTIHKRSIKLLSYEPIDIQ